MGQKDVQTWIRDVSLHASLQTLGYGKIHAE